MKLIIALFLIPLNFLQPQPKLHLRMPGQVHPLLFEINTFPDDSLVNFNYSYRISYNHLVFIKDGNDYEASLKISLELINSVKNTVTRQFEEKQVAVDNFESTNNKNLFVEGLIKLKISPGDYKILTFFTDNKLNKEFHLQPIFKRIKKTKKNFIKPLVVDSKSIQCSGNKFYSLTNYRGEIPFSENEYYLVIPSLDTTINSITLTMINNSDTVYDKKVTECFIGNGSLGECNGKILLDNNGSNYFKYFLVKNFSHKLKEGELKIEISRGNNSENSMA